MERRDRGWEGDVAENSAMFVLICGVYVYICISSVLL